MSDSAFRFKYFKYLFLFQLFNVFFFYPKKENAKFSCKHFVSSFLELKPFVSLHTISEKTVHYLLVDKGNESISCHYKKVNIQEGSF